MEASAFYLVLIAFCIFDIIKMTKSGLKKEIVPYLLLALLAGAAGLYLFNPEMGSIIRFLNNLLKLEG